MTDAAGIAAVLGITQRDPRSALSLVHEVERGLPLSALDSLALSLAPDDASFPYRLVPRATLARRRNVASRLTPAESARVARLADAWAFARKVWGSDAAAREFLFRPHMLLEGRRPVDVILANELGHRLVEGILGGLLYGTAV